MVDFELVFLNLVLFKFQLCLCMHILDDNNVVLLLANDRFTDCLFLVFDLLVDHISISNLLIKGFNLCLEFSNFLIILSLNLFFFNRFIFVDFNFSQLVSYLGLQYLNHLIAQFEVKSPFNFFLRIFQRLLSHG